MSISIQIKNNNKSMKKELTLEEWKEIGNKTKEIRKNFLELSNLLSRKFTKKEYMEKYLSADKKFGILRNHLDNIVCSKFLDMPDNEITRIFYGLNDKK